MLSAAFTALGERVGLYTSPHFISVRERIKIGQELIGEADFVKNFQVLHEAEQHLNLSLSFFEVLTALAFLHFKNAEVPLVILETGLGGRLDATNVVRPILSVITSIGLDHQAQLGNTFAAISKEKAGIIKKGVPVCVGQVGSASWDIIAKRARWQGSPIYRASHPASFSLLLKGKHQRRNAALSMKCLEVLRGKNDPKRPQAQKAIARLSLEGRYQLIKLQSAMKTSIDCLLDTAHNAQAASVLVPLLRESQATTTLVLGATSPDRAYQVGKRLLPFAKNLYVTQALWSPSCSARRLQEIFGKKAKIIALKSLFPKPNYCALKGSSQVLISGSSRLVGDVLALIRGRVPQAQGQDEVSPLPPLP